MVNTESAAYHFGQMAGGLTLAFVIASIIVFAIHHYFKAYEKNTIVIHPKAVFYKRISTIAIYFIAMLCALAKMLVFS